MPENSLFRDINVAILPAAGLGDNVVGLHLAWIFNQAGAKVTFFSNIFMSAREYFPWLEFLPCENRDVQSLSVQFDLVFVDIVLFLNVFDDLLKYDNVACISNKDRNFPDFGNRTLCVRGQRYSGADRPFCLDSKEDLSIVQGVDRYVHDVFGLDCPESFCIKASGTTTPKTRIAIFPISGSPQRDYFLCGFVWLAKRLNKDGWIADFVCRPSEHEKIQKTPKEIEVHSFHDIKALMDYLSGCTAVISNDSGGGHLGSLMGIKTFTIIRRTGKVAWRPGFFENHLLRPLIKLNWRRYPFWQLFIPIWRVPEILGKPVDLKMD